MNSQKIEGRGFIRNKHIFCTIVFAFFLREKATTKNKKKRLDLFLLFFLIFIIFYLVDDFFPELFTKQEKIVIYGAILLSIIMTGSRNALLAIIIFYVFQRFYNSSPF